MLLALLAPPAHANHLAGLPDPYLKMHAKDPVDWYPWTAEALARARAEHKPIFLSIGFSACVWCQTMERESFSDPAIAARMNAWFINIKVDREQRPDLDRVYALAADILAGSAGWPNNVFLTPEQAPFQASSYLPPQDDRFGQTGFASAIAAAHEAWTGDRAGTEAKAAHTVAAMRTLQAGLRGGGGPAAITPALWLQQAATRLAGAVDPENGGYGNGAGGRFPDAPKSALLIEALRRAADPAQRQALRETLDGLAFGGIHDQLGGGFHRTAIDRTWSIPHYEKMTADNAQLLSVYANAATLLGDTYDREVARSTAAWLAAMRLPQGGFATSQDSVTRGVEGGTYLWTRAQVAAVLGGQTGGFFAVYGIDSDDPATGGADEERGVLRVRVPVAHPETIAARLDPLAPDRAALLAARDRRPQPTRDGKIVAAVNGLAIAALAGTAAQLGRPEDLALAQAAAGCLWTRAWDGHALAHDVLEGRAEGAADLSDHAELGLGFLALADAGGDAVWRGRAAALADAMLARLGRADGGLAASAESAALVIAPREIGDDAAPAGDSSALDLLARLAALPDGARFAAPARRLAAFLAPAIAAHPDTWPSAVLAAVRGASVLAPPAMPDSADHVHATAALEHAPDGDRVVVTLAIDPGYHVNAHPASMDTLIATTLSLRGVPPVSVSYPPAAHFSLRSQALDVYDGTVRLVARYAPGVQVASAAGAVSVQACTASVCLPPAELPVEVR